jgi:quercetin dioxygenase-like cupin family protein
VANALVSGWRPFRRLAIARRRATAVLSIFTVIGFASAFTVAWARSPAVRVTTLFSGTETTAGQPITLPSGPVRLVVSQYVIPAGSILPVHRHPYARYGYVQAGRLKVTNIQSGVTKVFGPGDVIVEMIDIWHSATPVGAETVRLLVFDQLPPGAVATELRN